MTAPKPAVKTLACGCVVETLGEHTRRQPCPEHYSDVVQPTTDNAAPKPAADLGPAIEILDTRISWTFYHRHEGGFSNDHYTEDVADIRSMIAAIRVLRRAQEAGT